MNPVEIEKVVAPAAIERALAVYQQMRQQDHSVLMTGTKDPHPTYLRNGRSRGA
jgi:hypothetical protein